MPTYYDDEGDQYPERDAQDYMPSQIQDLIAQDRALTAQLPTAQEAQFTPAGPIGAASREYQSGRPGLFVQGGPTIPAGMIEVNGQLERSQAAPQPIPWWITAADQHAEQLRQEDFLRSLIAKMPQVQGTKAINRAMQLQGQLQLKSDLRAGVPFRDALVKNASNLYSGSPASLTHLAALRPVPKPATGVRTFTDPTGRVFYERRTGEVVPVPASPERASRGEVTPVDEYRAYQSNLRELRKDRRDLMKVGDKESLDQVKQIDADILKQTELMNQARKVHSGQSTAPSNPSPAEQTQTSPRVALANRLASEHPDWPKEKIISEVRKQLK